MIISSSWLKRYIALPKDFNSLLSKLSLVGLDAQSVQSCDLDTSHLRIAEILDSGPHPNADRLSVCQVKTHSGEYRIVCGAKNYRIGNKAILAIPGAKLPNGMEIKESKIRGEKSQGMLCSEVELGLQKKSTENSSGILILSQDTSLKADLRQILGLGNTIVELNVTPNRSDWLSMYGIAREISAVIKKPLCTPVTPVKEGKTLLHTKVKVKLKDSSACTRYMARLITGIRVGPSPDWIKESLESVGLRSINNVVDVTNFVLMEWGQPLHAFDFEKIKGATIIVRLAREGERLVTLDGKEQTLKKEDLLICDPDQPLALAGVMGGQSAEVKESTTSILLESACFNPISIRKTSRRLGLISESSKRFERGVDIEAVEKALDRAAMLIVETSGGEIAKGKVDCYPKKFKKRIATVTLDRIYQYLGYEISSSEVKEILKRLGFIFRSFGAKGLVFEIPSYRSDVQQEVDLIEEIARFKGYQWIPNIELKGNANLSQKISSDRDYFLSSFIRQSLVTQGLSEAINYSFYSPADLKKLGWTSASLGLQNPLGEEYSRMRPTLIPSLLKNLHDNLNHQNARVRLFELGNVYDATQHEKQVLAGILSGERHTAHWSVSHESVDFFDTKALVYNVLSDLGVDLNALHLETHGLAPYYQPGQSAVIFYHDHQIASLGKLHVTVQSLFELKSSAYIFEVDVEMVKTLPKSKSKYERLPKYPSIRRDLSFLIPLDFDLTNEKVVETILKTAQPLGSYIQKIELFDIYTGSPVPEGYRSFAYSLIYVSKDRTLTDLEINEVHKTVSDALIHEFHVQIRE